MKILATDSLLCGSEHIRSAIYSNKVASAAFIELSKAFDSMTHDILKEKLNGLIFGDKAI